MTKDLALRILVIGNAVFIVIVVIFEILKRSGAFDQILAWMLRNTARIMDKMGLNRTATKIRKELGKNFIKGG